MKNLSKLEIQKMWISKGGDVNPEEKYQSARDKIVVERVEIDYFDT